MSKRCESIGWHGYQCVLSAGHTDSHNAMSYAFGLRVWNDDEETPDD